MESLKRDIQIANWKSLIQARIDSGMTIAQHPHFIQPLQRTNHSLSLRPFASLPAHLRAKSRLRRLRFETRLWAQPLTQGEPFRGTSALSQESQDS